MSQLPVGPSERVLTSQHKLPEKKVSDRFKHISVLGLVADTSACGYYRVVNPLHYLKMHGAKVHYSSHQSMQGFQEHEYIIAPRQHSKEIYEILRNVMLKDRKVVIGEIDDDLDAVSPLSPAYPAYHKGSPALSMIHKVMSWMDGVTTTTPEMARWCYQNNRNVAVIENYIDFGFRNWSAEVTHDDFGNPNIKPLQVPRPPEWEGKQVILYSCGSTHQEDLQLLGPQIKELLKRNPTAHFALYTADEIAREFFETYKIEDSRCTTIPARHFLDFPEGMMGADIGLCPLVCNQFNLAKSFLKPTEYMALGIVPVTSNVGPYARFDTRHPGHIIKVGDAPSCKTKSLIEGVQLLLDNPELLKKMKVEGRQLVYEKYSLEKNIHKYPAAWNVFKEKKFKGDGGPPVNKKPKSAYVSYKSFAPSDKCPCGSNLTYQKCCKTAWG